MSFLKRFFNILVLLTSAIETVAVASLVFLVGLVALPVAIGIRFVLFTAEHIVSFIRVNGASALTGLDLGRILVVAAVETATWDVWFFLAPLNQVGAGGVLVGGLYVGHVFEQNTTRQCSNFFTGLIRLEAVGITVIETVTGIVWRILALLTGAFLPIFSVPFRVIAAGVLFVGLNIEHAKAAGQARRCY